MKVRVLGCGGSGGVPLIGDKWGNCDPGEPKNRRRRVSILVEEGATTLLIDTSPDLREQLLDARTGRLDAVLFTHAHADHLHGIDDLRSVNRLMRAPIAVYANAETLEKIGQRFGYVFIVCATGKSSEEMLALLQQRLQNDPAAELRIAAEEQRRITHLRLQKLFQA